MEIMRALLVMAVIFATASKLEANLCLQKPRARSLVYFIHGIRVPANASQVQSILPALGQPFRTQLPFPVGYAEVVNNKITEAFEYDSPQIGLYQGQYAIVRDAIASLHATISLNTQGYAGRFNIGGPYDFAQTVNTLPISGSLGERVLLLGNQTASVIFKYGMNGVVKGEARFYFKDSSCFP